jgi:Ni/Co efflux regulator RcnB
MKIVFAILLTQTLTLGIALAQKSRPVVPKKTSEQRICDRLLERAQIECDEIMCGEYEQEGIDCERDGDYAEGHQICVYDDTLPSMIEDYNRSHLKEQVTCEDI